MQSKHVPSVGTRYWSALCIASVFGANMGDFCARYLGLGHVKGLPILGVMLVIIFMVESRDRYAHQTYYWLAIIVIRTAATNLADFAAGDKHDCADLAVSPCWRYPSVADSQRRFPQTAPCRWHRRTTSISSIKSQRHGDCRSSEQTGLNPDSAVEKSRGLIGGGKRGYKRYWSNDLVGMSWSLVR